MSIPGHSFTGHYWPDFFANIFKLKPFYFHLTDVPKIARAAAWPLTVLRKPRVNILMAIFYQWIVQDKTLNATKESEVLILAEILLLYRI